MTTDDDIREARNELDLAERRFHRESVRLATDDNCSNKPWFDAKVALDDAAMKVATLVGRRLGEYASYT